MKHCKCTIDNHCGCIVGGVCTCNTQCYNSESDSESSCSEYEFFNKNESDCSNSESDSDGGSCYSNSESDSDSDNECCCNSIDIKKKHCKKKVKKCCKKKCCKKKCCKKKCCKKKCCEKKCCEKKCCDIYIDLCDVKCKMKKHKSCVSKIFKNNKGDMLLILYKTLISNEDIDETSDKYKYIKDIYKLLKNTLESLYNNKCYDIDYKDIKKYKLLTYYILDTVNYLIINDDDYSDIKNKYIKNIKRFNKMFC